MGARLAFFGGVLEPRHVAESCLKSFATAVALGHRSNFRMVEEEPTCEVRWVSAAFLSCRCPLYTLFRSFFARWGFIVRLSFPIFDFVSRVSRQSRLLPPAAVSGCSRCFPRSSLRCNPFSLWSTCIGRFLKMVNKRQPSNL